MRYAFRKQTKSDFTARLQRIDPVQGARNNAADKTSRRPVFWTLTGFGWCYLVLCIASRKEHIRESLLQGSMPAQSHDMILAGLAALLAVSGVMLGIHLLRYVTKRGAVRANSGNLLFGALAAVTLIYTPPSVFEAGFGMLDANSRSILLAAHATVKQTVPDVDWAGIVLLASNGR